MLMFHVTCFTHERPSVCVWVGWFACSHSHRTKHIDYYYSYFDAAKLPGIDGSAQSVECGECKAPIEYKIL